VPQNPPSTEPDAVNKLVLIGEDDLDDQELFREIFSSIDTKLDLQFVSNGAGVISFIENCEEHRLPCLIILDYNMPELSGADILELLQKNNRCKDIPKIIWSTSGSEMFKKRCLELGASAYIIKPSSVSDLKEIATHMLSFCGS
jgi:CheY-like chemotaxis protein